MEQHIFCFAIILVTVATSMASTRGLLAWTETGWVRGIRRHGRDGQEFASFQGIPYAKPPVGVLRFKEPQPAEPWDGILDATTEGPICPYPSEANLLFGPLLQPKGVSEACIFVNVYVPIHALPNPNCKRVNTGGLPIVVLVPGGAWIIASGDTDINGPEYLMGKGIIVVTFNHRTGAPGFLSLNNSKIPGNNALRDMLSVLRWVQANARYFGGNPEEVTLAGKSVGGTAVHLLTLSPAAKGMFKRAWLTNTAIQTFYTASPAYAKEVADMLLSYLGITSTNEDEIYNQLINTPIEKLTEASGKVIAQKGLTSFVPVVESRRPGFTTIIPEDPEVLIAEGRGNDIPIVIGFNSKECETQRPRLVAGNVVAKFEQNPSIAVYRDWVYSLPSQKVASIAERLRQRYFSGIPTIDEYVRMCSDSQFAYPAVRTASLRVTSGGAPVYLYKYGYTEEYSALRQAFNLTYCGAGHNEDIAHIFKVNSWPLPSSKADDAMTGLMTDLFVNFVKYGDPSHRDVSWPPYPFNQYFYIGSATDKQYVEMSQYDREMVQFYDSLTEFKNTPLTPRAPKRTYHNAYMNIY